MAIVKTPMTVNLKVSIKQMVLGAAKPLVGILTNTTKVTDTKIYKNMNDLMNDYDETTSVYDMAEAMFNVPNFNGPIEVIPYNPSASVKADGGQVTVKATDFGSPAANTIASHLYDGFYYLVADTNVPEADLEKLSDFLYENQRLALLCQFTTQDDVNKLETYVKGQQTDVKEKLSNVFAQVETQTNRYPVAQEAAYASINVPCDFAHIGNLTQMNPDPDLTQDDYDAINALNASTVVNRADDLMNMSGKALGGNYLDQFVHIQMINDDLQQGIQRFLNANNFPSYTDDTVNLIEKIIEGVSDKYVKLGILSDPIVTVATPISGTSTDDRAARSYNGFSFSYTVNDDIQNINANVSITV